MSKMETKFTKKLKNRIVKEMRKHRLYFKEHGVFCLIFTDEELKNTKSLFDKEFLPYLQLEKPQVQLSFEIMEEFFNG